MPFELRDHTADVAVAARGASLGETFAAVADGLTAAMCDDVPDDVGDRVTLTVRASGQEAALYDYLDQLIYERDVRNVLPVDNRATVRIAGDEAAVHGDSDGVDDVVDVDGDPDDDADEPGDDVVVVEASARGVPLSAVVAREVKAVTYSEMRLSETDGGWEAYVVFDV